MGEQAKLTEEFMTSFSLKKNEILKDIETLEAGKPDINDKLNGILLNVQQLNKLLHDAVKYLPSYSVKVWGQTYYH